MSKYIENHEFTPTSLIPILHKEFILFSYLSASLTPSVTVRKLLPFSLLTYLINVVVQSLSHVQLFATPWTATFQASLSFTISWSLLKFISIESVTPSNHLILCHPLLLLSVFPSIRVISSELALSIRWPKY